MTNDIRERIKNLSKLGQATCLLIGASIGLMIWETISSLRIIAFISSAQGGAPITKEGVEAAFMDAASLFSGLGFMVAGICFLFWFNSRFKVLKEFAIGNLRHTSKQAVYLFFIPIINLYKPERIAQEIWRASDPESEGYDPKSKTGRSRLIEAWWIFFVIFFLISSQSTRLSSMAERAVANSQSHEEVLNGLASLSTALWVLIGANISGLIAGGLVLAVILQIEERQAEKRSKLPPGSSSSLSKAGA